VSIIKERKIENERYTIYQKIKIQKRKQKTGYNEQGNKITIKEILSPTPIRIQKFSIIRTEKEATQKGINDI